MLIPELWFPLRRKVLHSKIPGHQQLAQAANLHQSHRFDDLRDWPTDRLDGWIPDSVTYTDTVYCMQRERWKLDNGMVWYGMNSCTYVHMYRMYALLIWCSFLSSFFYPFQILVISPCESASLWKFIHPFTGRILWSAAFVLVIDFLSAQKICFQRFSMTDRCSAPNRRQTGKPMYCKKMEGPSLVVPRQPARHWRWSCVSRLQWWFCGSHFDWFWCPFLLIIYSIWL